MSIAHFVGWMNTNRRDLGFRLRLYPRLYSDAGSAG